MKNNFPHQKANQNNREYFSFRAVSKGLIKGFILTIILYVISSIIVQYFGLPKTLIPSIAWWMVVIGICFGGMCASRIVGSKGWLHGALTGIFFIIVIIIVNFIFFRNFVVSSTLFKLVIGIFAGMIGGIIGINL
ncbi:MAG TPA: TIGR04086 family membrane protein [Clostridia bacterium]|nr:TIGR04086 family membrane protein [Clostridia bacterium]